MTAFLATLFKTLLASVVEWFQGERAEADQWAAKAKEQMLDSMKEGMKEEIKLRKQLVATEAKATSFSPSDWAAGKTLLLVISVLGLSGCFRFYVYNQQYQPVPPSLPPRPAYELAEGEVVGDREVQVIRYAATVEKAYNDVRESVIKQNIKAGYPETSE